MTTRSIVLRSDNDKALEGYNVAYIIYGNSECVTVRPILHKITILDILFVYTSCLIHSSVHLNATVNMTVELH